MRVIKMLGAALIGFAALIGAGASAQTPVSCNLVLISSDGPPDGSSRYITHQCIEANGNVVATRNLIWTKAANGYTSCVISTSTNITWSGACLSPSFYRTVVTSSSSSASSCTTPGARVQGGCANSYNPGMLTSPTYLSRCGSGCTLEYRTLGWTSTCPNSGEGRSPEYGLFCK